MVSFLLAGFSARTDHLVFERGIESGDDRVLRDLQRLLPHEDLSSPWMIGDANQIKLLRERHGISIRGDRRYVLVPVPSLEATALLS